MIVLALAVALVVGDLRLGLSPSGTAAAPAGSVVTPAESAVAPVTLPLRFEANAGQMHADARFVMRGTAYDLFLTDGEAVASLPQAAGSPAHAIRLGFAGARPVEPTGVDRLAGTTNYLAAERTVTGAPGYGAVEYDELYPGVDLRFHERQGRGLEYVFTVAPGADPEAIGLSVKGAEPSIEPGGDLVLASPAGDLRQSAPVLYQDIDGQRLEVAGAFVLRQGGEVGFEVGAYDASHPLVIDPVLAYASYLGGVGRDRLIAVAVDEDGAAYITGSSTSPDFPTTEGAYQQESDPAEPRIFVAKLSPDGSDLVYATYLGQGGGERAGSAIAVDAEGAAYVSGRTDSPDFPTTDGALQQEFGGGESDAFVAKLSPDGAMLEYGSFLGGGEADAAFAIAVGGDGAAHVAGTTGSENFPTTPDVFQANFLGGESDGFASVISSDGSALAWSSYVGGSAYDTASGLGVGPDGSTYIGGDTRSGDLPTSPGAFQGGNPSDVCPAQSRGGGGGAPPADPERLCLSAYVVKLGPTGGQQFATYLGGSGEDTTGTSSPAHDAKATLGVADDGSAVIVGSTQSADFPLTDGAFLSVLPNGEAPDGERTTGYVSRLNPEGTDLVYSTFLGGRVGIDNVHVGADATVTVAGTAESELVPLQEPLAVYSGNHDAYVGRLNPEGTELVFGTTLGGRKVELRQGMTVGPDGDVFVVGDAQSDDFPVTPEAFETTAPGGLSGFVARISPAPEGEPFVTSIAPRSGPEIGGTEVVITGRDLSEASSVAFGNEPAEEFTVDSPSQITATSPPGSGSGRVTVTTPAGITPPNPTTEFTYAEGMWETTGTMSTIRFDASLTLLDDGRVLVAGGRTEIQEGDTVETAELYDPLTGEWSPTGSMTEPRSHHTATLLPNGTVLVAGGLGADESTGLATAEIFDPSNGTWSTTSGLSEGRGDHVAVRLDDGQVLVTGGSSGRDDPRVTTEVYDPSSGSWNTTGPMTRGRTSFAGDLLADGRVLVAGGEPQLMAGREAEVYDPAAGTWSPVAPMAAEHVQHHGITLDDGRVLMATGLGAGRIAEVYDPVTDEWTASAMINDRYTPLLGPLANGQVMVAGGTDGGASAELYDPTTNEWTSAGVMHRARPSWRNGQRHELVLLSSNPDEFADDPAVCGEHCGKLLAAGNTVTRVAELYTPAPEVTAVSPDGASAAGDEVTITGFAFSGATQVLFGDQPATDMTVVSSTEIVVTSPGDLGETLDVIVTTPAGVSSANEEAQPAVDGALAGDQQDQSGEGSFSRVVLIVGLMAIVLAVGWLVLRARRRNGVPGA